MITRRMAVGAAAVGLLGAGGGVLGSRMRQAGIAYEQAVSQTWRRPAATPGVLADPLQEAVRYATLAASSHNTQCWRFRVRGASVQVLPDPGLRLPVVDPDDHHLFASIGCATENLVVSAGALGLHATEEMPGDGSEGVVIRLEKAKPRPSALFEAIALRQSTRGEYDGSAVSPKELGTLQAAGTRPGVTVHLFTAPERIEDILDFVVQGNSAQMRDHAFVAELKQWVRFNGAHAARTRDGLYAGSSGNPSLPEWLGARMFDLAFTEGAENRKYARHIRSSAGVAVFVADREDRRHWIEAGRSFQRFALQATVLGLRTAHVNQPVEVPALRPAFAGALGLAGRPDLVVRFGRGPALPRSLRRPVAAVLEREPPA